MALEGFRDIFQTLQPEHKQQTVEMPDDSGDALHNMELPDDSGEARNNTSEKEISEGQKRAIAKGFLKLAKGENLSDQEKGNFGEMLMDQYYLSQGYKPLHARVTDLNEKGHQGLDGVYEKEMPDGTKEYVIADAKYNMSTLSRTVDGTMQMSDAYIDKRLDAAVGKEKADEIRDAYEDNPDCVHREVYHYNPKVNESGWSTSDVSTVEPDGVQNHDKETVEVFDRSGHRIDGADMIYQAGREMF